LQHIDSQCLSEASMICAADVTIGLFEHTVMETVVNNWVSPETF